MLTNLASLLVKTRNSSSCLLPDSFESRKNADERRERLLTFDSPTKVRLHQAKSKQHPNPAAYPKNRIVNISHCAEDPPNPTLIH